MVSFQLSYADITGAEDLAVTVINFFFNRKYVRYLVANGGSLPPEARLPLCALGGLCLPVGLFVSTSRKRTVITKLTSLIP